jgi:hypothetical protein
MRSSKRTFAIIYVLTLFLCLCLTYALIEQINILKILPGGLGVVSLLGMVLWNACGLIFITKTLWLAHFVQLIGIGYAVLRKKVQSTETNKFEFKQTEFLKKVEVLESLVRDFNKHFTTEILLTLLSHSILVLNNLYAAIQLVVNGGGVTAGMGLAAYAPAIVVNSMGIFLLCTVAARITMEVRI